MELVRPYIIFYIIIFGIYLFSLAFPIKGIGAKNKDWYFVVAATLVLLLLGTRSENVGTDTIDYVSFFLHPDNYSFVDDVFFNILINVLRLFGSSTEYFIFMISLLGLAGLYYMINKYSDNKVLSVALFTLLGPMELFFFLYFSMIRQTIALSLFFVAVSLLFDIRLNKRKQLLFFFLFYILACLTHKSALFALPFIALVYLKPVGSKTVWVALILTTYILAGLEFSITNTVLSKVFELLGGDSHYAHYADITIGAVESRGFIHLGIVPFIIMGLVVTVFSDKKLIDNWIIQLFLWSVVMNNIFFDNLNYNRLTLYLTMFAIVAMPNALKNMKAWVKVPTLVFVFGYFTYKMIGQLIFQMGPIPTGNIIVPYESWLFSF